MRKQLIMMMAVMILGTSGLISAQDKAIADPNGASATTANGGGTAAEATMAPATANNNAGAPAPATAAVAPATATKKQKKDKKVNTDNMRPDDPRKNPWWDPKDWEYIYNQGP